MKRLVIAFCLVAVAVLLAVWSGITFEKKMNNLSDSLNELINCAETCNDSELYEKTKKTVAQWKNASGILHSLVMHEGMDEIEENITALPLIIVHSDRDEFKIKCIEAINRIENLLNAEKLNLENIL